MLCKNITNTWRTTTPVTTTHGAPLQLLPISFEKQLKIHQKHTQEHIDNSRKQQLQLPPQFLPQPIKHIKHSINNTQKTYGKL